MFLHLSVFTSVHKGVYTPPRQIPPPRAETATAADGTHPTGMHSCLGSVYT